jgi:hypothetical protein
MHDELHRQIAELVTDHADRATPPPAAVIRRWGRRRRARLAAVTAGVVLAVLVAGTLGIDRLTSRLTTLAPALTTSPPTSIAPIPRSVTAFTPLDVKVHIGPFQGTDRLRMVNDATGILQQCEGGTAEVRAWAQVLGKTWLLAAKPPPPGKNWICWSDSLREAAGAGVVADHGGPSNRLKPLQASNLASASVGKNELSVVGGPVTKQAVRLRIVPRKGRPLEVVPFDAGAQFPVNFYAVFYLEPAKTAWMPERVIAYDKAGRRIAECWATTRTGDVCDRPQGAPQPP